MHILIIIKYTTIQKFVVSKIEFFFIREVSYRLHLFDQRYNKNSQIMKYYYNLK